MLRLILAAVLVSACLAYPQRREDAPVDAANLQGFGPGAMPQALPGLQGMQGMQGMPAGQFQPFLPNFGGMGYKRAADENLEERRMHSNFHGDNKAPFDSESGPADFMKFLEDNADKLPFANAEDAPADLGNFEPNAENDQGENKFRFFNQDQ